MSTRERRSLWGSISRSKKVSALSDRALILYTLTIPHLDDEGFIEADPRFLKSVVVPLRDNIQIKDIGRLIEEISTVHTRVQSSQIPLWTVHKTSEGDFIQDPVFNERQSFKGIRKKPSKIKDVVDKETNGCQEGDGYKTKGFISEGKGEGECKEKGNVKGSEVETENKKVFTTSTTERLMDLFNSVTQYLPKVSEIGKGRRDKIKTRIKEGKNNLEWWEIVFREADIVLIPGKSGKKDWFPNFDWLIENDRNAVKVFEGNYRDAKRPIPPFKPQPGIEAFLKKHRKEDGGLNEP
jgi:hypothetical protein